MDLDKLRAQAREEARDFLENDKEYRIGYVKVLANYIGELFGVEVKELDETLRGEGGFGSTGTK